MDAARRLVVLRDVCSLPTAPFAEHAVMEFVRRFATALPTLHLAADRFGNLLIERLPRRRGPRWVFTAHMDHPGLISTSWRRGVLKAEFHGGVPAKLLAGARVRFWEAGGQVTRATILRATTGPGGWATAATLACDVPLPPGLPGVLDLGPTVLRRRRLAAVACDDLAGVAACLAFIANAQPPSAVLLTRAEEIGFVGAIAAARSLKLLRPDDVVINLEASAAGPQAPQGRGPVIRVGDRTSVFDPAVTAVLTSQAQELTASDKRFRYQRALMAGGTCEATAFSALGLRAGSLCVPLGNYHNVDRRRGRLARETIDVDDWLGMLRLMLAVASSPPKVADWRPRLRRRLVERSAPLAKRLARTANGRRAPRSR